MNERIKELANEALLYVSDRESPGTVEINSRLENFAELIVRECIQQLRYKSAKLVDVDYFPEYKEQLEKHFGIKE